MEHSEFEDMRTYAWQFFLAHAQARLTTFRFYVGFCTILCAGIFGIIGGQSGLPQAAAPLAFLLAFLSFVYWKVDQRHRSIVCRARDALAFLEDRSGLPDVDSKPHPMKLFLGEELLKRNRAPFIRSFCPSSVLTYSECVNLVFVVFGIGGFLAGIFLLAAWR